MDVRDTPVVTWLNSAVCVVAAVSATAVAASWLLTFTPWSRLMPSAYFAPFFALLFPLFGWAVFVVSVVRRRERPERKPGDLLEEVPPGARIPVILAAVAAGVSFLTGIRSLPGQPGYDPAKHRYFYDNGGTLIPTTHAGYLHAVAAQNRLFLGVTLVFTSAAAAIARGERRRRRGGWPGRLDRPGRPVPGGPDRGGNRADGAAGLAPRVPGAGSPGSARPGRAGAEGRRGPT